MTVLISSLDKDNVINGSEIYYNVDGSELMDLLEYNEHCSNLDIFWTE